MNYKETLDWMYLQLPMYQRQGATAFKKDLTNSIALSGHLKNPEKQFKTIHVAGTNGKGSTSHMIASILQESGMRVGLYTSPHLKDFRERIRINGRPIGAVDVVDFIESNKDFLEDQKLSFFEMTVGMAFHYFAIQNVDIAVVEVGLGGRLDSTNIVSPVLSVITNIGYDHTQFLGETLEEIAFEKAGIIKANIPVVIGEYQEEVFPIFEDLADARKAHLHLVSVEDEYETDLLGHYQQKNIKTAVQVALLLQEIGYMISRRHIELGLKKVVENTGLLGRWQVLQEFPKIICDTAHNREGLELVFSQLMGEQFEDLHIVLGVVNDKNLELILPMFPKRASYYFCRPDIPRGLDAHLLKETAGEFGLIGEVFGSVAAAMEQAKLKATSNDLIFVGGSTFVVAEVI